MKPKTLTFSEVDIQKLFGHEAAEDEDPQRLREYYFKTSTYDQVVTDLPLRIVVGHKGIGKSALFQVAMREDEDRERLAILIKPDDVIGLGTDTSDFLLMIRNWKEGLVELLAKKVRASVGASTNGIGARLKRSGALLIDFLRETFTREGVSYKPAQRVVVERFL